MSQQLYGRNREEPYATSYGYGQGSNFVPKIPPVAETRQSQKKPVFINYYPSGNTNNPQKVIAQVETVTRRDVVQSPGPMVDPMMEARINHHGDGQSKREDEFINKLRDETIKATADFNEASRIIEPKVLSANLDQLQLSEQPRKHHGNGTMNDGWVEPADPNQPRKVAELMSRVSNWKGGNSGARPISSDGYNKLGDGISRDNNGWNKMPNVRKGYEHMGYGSDSRRTTPRSEELGYYSTGNRGGATDDLYTRRDDIIDQHTPRASGAYGISQDNVIDNGWNKMAPNVTRGYEHTGYGGDSRSATPRSEETGYYNGNRGGKAHDVYTRRDDIIDLHAPRASGGGYTSNPPPLTQQVRYDDPNPMDSRYPTYGSGYNPGMGNHNGRIEKAVEYDQVYGNGYNPGLPRSSYGGRAKDSRETLGTTVITSVDAVTKYKGTFVPLMRNGEQRKPHVPVKI